MNIFEELGKYDVIIMSGIPGSGKSHIAKQLETEIYCSADDFFMCNREYFFNPNELGTAHRRYCMCKFLAAINVGAHIIVDNTNIEAWEISPYVAVAEARGLRVCIIQVNCDPKVAAARNQHGVPERTINRMANRLANRHLPPHWKVIQIDN